MLRTKNILEFKDVKFLGKVESIPKHWDFNELERIGSIAGGGTPDTTVEEYWNGVIPWVVPSEITGLLTRKSHNGNREDYNEKWT